MAKNPTSKTLGGTQPELTLTVIDINAIDRNEKWWPDLYLRKGRKLLQIQPEECQPLMEKFVNGRGASEVGSQPIALHDIDGNKIGHISYNGRVWLHDAEGDVEVPVAGCKTAADHDRDNSWGNDEEAA